ncbi:MAG: isoaspartyl peptidase [Chitinophagales bacterium]|nr:MAG: isoaspartyl peptidase [Chitinophagales bacterium]
MPGRGSVFTRAGTHEMDASIMDGRTLQAGAVAGVKTIKNPIKAARAVMERTPHVMLIGEGADAFAREQGLQTADPTYFFDEYRYRQYQQTQPLKQPVLDHSDDKGQLPQSENTDEYGTVGAVALDRYGNLAAATSTGGMTNKLPGRIGDTPIIGAGTYANNHTCAVSCTGHGEYFIRTVAAHMVSDLMQYRHHSPEEAVHTVLDSIAALGAGGGIIALDKQGRLTMQFTTTAMLRGFVTQDGKTKVYIFKP